MISTWIEQEREREKEEKEKKKKNEIEERCCCCCSCVALVTSMNDEATHAACTSSTDCTTTTEHRTEATPNRQCRKARPIEQWRKREKKTGRVISRRQWEPREKRKRRGEQLNRARNAAEIEMKKKKKKKALQRKKAPALSWYGLIIETQLAVQPPPPPEWTYLDRGLLREIKDRERGTTVWNRSKTDLVLKMWSKQAAEHHLQLCLTFC